MKFNFKNIYLIVFFVLVGNFQQNFVFGEVNSVAKPSQNLPYTPVITPNGSTMPWTIDPDGAKVFHLTVET